MRFSPFVERIAGQGVAAWDIHHAAFQAASQGEDIIILSVGDPDFATPSFITDAAVSALREGDTHYTEIPGRPALREAIAARYSKTLGRRLNAENVITVAGAQNALFVTSLCLLQAGDEVLVLDPMYVTYEATLKASGATLVRVPCSPESGFRLDAQLLGAAITPRTRAIFFSNPNNPTGVVLNPHELQAIADLAIAHDLWVVVDEVYESLVFDGEYHSLAALPGMAERCVVIGSLSKSHAMTGWRIGFATGPRWLLEAMEKLQGQQTSGASAISQHAAIAALNGPQDFIRQSRAVFERRRDLVVSLLNAIPGLACISPSGAFYAFASCAGLLGRTSAAGRLLETDEDVAHALLDEANVAVVHGSAFGLAPYLRIAYALDDDSLRQACAAIHRFCAATR